MADLKNINWKRHANTVVKVLMDIKVLGLLILMGFTVYGIGWETVLRPTLDELKSRDQAMDEQRKTLTQRSDLQKQYGVWEQQLKTLDTHMIPIQPGDQTNLIALTIADELRKLAKGDFRDENVLPPLPPPHNKREGINLTQGSNTTIDILKMNGDAPAAPAEATTPEATKRGGFGRGQEAAPATTLPVERYDYTLKINGTYPALVDVINEMTVHKKLIQINKITITKPASADADAPDFKDDPEYPLKLDMEVALSIFLYAPDQPTAAGHP